MAWGVTEQTKHLEKLLVPGVIGMYRSVEVTEIVGFRRDIPATNFLSLLVAEPGEPPAASPSRTPFINGKPMTLRGTEWKFGVSRYRIAPQQVLDALRRFGEMGEWKPGDSALRVGTLTAVPPQFVPSDSRQPHPWNSVLKNNFWDGSHVIELFDTTKSDVRFLLDEPKLLTDLAALIRPHVPVGIDGLSDRLGNVLIQLPVTVVTTSVRSSQENDLRLQPTWHPKATARPLRVSCEMYEDATVEGFGSKAVESELAKLPLHSPGGGARYVVWDDTNEVIVGASAQTAFITSVGLSISIMGESSTTREFMVPAADGQFKLAKVPLKQEERPNVIGKSYPNPREPWRTKRVFRDSLHKLQQRKEFVQYGGPSAAGRTEAITDIRWLLEQHGKAGAWLWDPYLDAKDVLNTLFFCPHPGADLRALTAGNEPPCPGQAVSATATTSTAAAPATQAQQPPSSASTVATPAPTSVPQPAAPSWKAQQVTAIQGAKGNCEGLKLEFRIREGGAGWTFHDRFLIFPGETGGALAWSLGTSVNSLGRQHHILQKVSDGELIRQAFLELWNALAAPDYLVWKMP